LSWPPATSAENCVEQFGNGLSHWLGQLNRVVIVIVPCGRVTHFKAGILERLPSSPNRITGISGLLLVCLGSGDRYAVTICHTVDGDTSLFRAGCPAGQPYG